MRLAVLFVIAIVGWLALFAAVAANTADHAPPAKQVHLIGEK